MLQMASLQLGSGPRIGVRIPPGITHTPTARFSAAERGSSTWRFNCSSEAIPRFTAPVRLSCERTEYPLKMARRKGFEPLTPRFEVWCSIQLSYRRMRVWNSAAQPNCPSDIQS